MIQTAEGVSHQNYDFSTINIECSKLLNFFRLAHLFSCAFEVQMPFSDTFKSELALSC